MPSNITPVSRLRVALHNTHTNLSRRIYFGREADAREFFVRLVTNPRIDFAELARIEGTRVVEVIATHSAAGGEPDGGAR